MLTKLRSFGFHPALVMSTVVFASSPLAFFLTAYAPIERWHITYAVRVAWQLGGAIALGSAIVLTTPPRRRRARRAWTLAFAWLVIGWLMAENPALDLVQGPACEQKETVRVTLLRHTDRVLESDCR